MQAKVCPNCGSDQIDDRNYCPECDVIYNITAKETTPKKMGRMDQLEDRVSKLEGDNGTSNAHQLPGDDRPASPGPAGPQGEDQDPDQDEDPDPDDEDDLLLPE